MTTPTFLGRNGNKVTGILSPHTLRHAMRLSSTFVDSWYFRMSNFVLVYLGDVPVIPDPVDK